MKKKYKIITFIMILIICVFGYMVIETDYFTLKKLSVVGQVKLSRQDILISGKIESGKNIYKYSSKEIRKNLLKNPYIEDANVKIKLPDKIIIDLKERVAMCAIPYMGSYALINEEGIVLKVEDDLKNVDVPLIGGINLQKLKIGQNVDLKDDELLNKILDLLNACNNAKILSNISQINIDNSKNIDLYTINGIRVLLGKGEDLHYKMIELNKILIDLYTKNIKAGIVDMRYDSYPVYRPE
ncbi:cell division protein FtsQ/DivIB [Tepidibacter hydrothermalis]|uniref:FtsQ-type POTRA domain-containing protein n=1 Tax=Tepidibacter hydrothermalis TaxID=3036126 RepID=A0ABY8EBJ6_9FIRM|nr:FtsQ-type POTRA domain-containing protein [Tepidibacter hydrothermalis]WFD09149.1 FtsQ-type POTRA domain-containing protein [Tepidibacter hydrothermalis]